MQYDTRQILHDREQDAAYLDGGPAICEQCSLAELKTIGARLFDATAPQAATAQKKPRLGEASWLWLALSLALHATLLGTLASAGMFSFEPASPPLESIVELNLGDLAGTGGSGGDGQSPGGGDGRQAGDTAREAPNPEAAPEPEPSPPPQVAAVALPAEDVPAASLEDKKPPESPKPEEKADVAPPRKQAPQPKPDPKPAARTAPPRRPLAAKAPQAPPEASRRVSAVPGGQGQGAGMGHGEGAPGSAGQGQGTGPGFGPGAGGHGGEGPGGGGGGEYLGEFGKGDGPTFRHRAAPVYPVEARLDGLEGTVVLRLALDAEGELKDAEVVRQTGLDFAKAALRAVRASTFFPARRGGHPVPCRALLTVLFKLD